MVIDIRDEILELEDARWRKESYGSLLETLNDVICYKKEHKGKGFLFEIHTKRSEKADEVIVILECSRDSFLGRFFGKCRFFAKDRNNGVREIEGEEAF